MAADPNHLRFFAKYIEGEIGIVYADANYFQLEHRLNDIACLLGLKDVAALWEKGKVGIDGQFRDLLLDLATNNETSFFRDTAVFKALTEKMVPDLLAENPGLAKIRLWSAAGSTGQEAYSIAMALEQARADGAVATPVPDYEILVTDVSERVQKKSKDGVYTQLEAQRGLPSRLLVQYFEKASESEWRAKDLLRSKLSFRRLNLLEPFPYLGEFDIVFCRNVLIYQSVENKSAVVEKIARCMGPRRYLVLGAAESMLGVSNAFDQMHHGTAVYYKKKAA